MAFVADASVAAAWVLPDEDAAVADVALDRLDAETAMVPGIFWHELRNLLLSAERRGRIEGGYADASMARLRRLSIVCPDETGDREVMALARPSPECLRCELSGARDARGLRVGEPRPAPERDRYRRGRDDVRLIMEAEAALSETIALAWQAFDRAAERTCRVTPAVPILFFGDLGAYRASPLRVVTVGLNPSLKEFPADVPFRRFPLAEGNRTPSRYLDAMSAYSRTDPYNAWFNAFEPMLNGLGASYSESAASTVLHTDVCSPVATDPTCNQLDNAIQETLEPDGRPLWHMLL